jgi:hypothetical protein
LEPKVLLGVDVEAAFVDVELKTNDGLFFRIQAPSIVDVATSYGCCCSCCSRSTRVKKE